MAHSPTHSRRVVVSGIGVISPLGRGTEVNWHALCSARSGISTIQRFDPSGLPVRIAGEIPRFDPQFAPPSIEQKADTALLEQIRGKDVRRLGRFAQLGIHAGLDAYFDAGLHEHRGTIAPKSIGVNIGSGMGGLPEIAETHLQMLERGPRRVSPFFILQSIPNIASGQLSVMLNLRGPNLCNVTACTTSAHSIGESYRLIQRGDADIMLAGGTESVISPLTIAGFCAMRALSEKNDDPASASRPFDRTRDGFVIGEGATVLVLETLESAQRRNAAIYAEITGYGLSSDAYHLATPAPEGRGAKHAMQMALESAGLKPNKIDYVNAHATSTPAGDIEEARAIASVFGDNRQRPLIVSSTKSMTGHLLGAAGAFEAMVCAMSVFTMTVPPTAHLNELDEGCRSADLDFCTGGARKTQVRHALSNSFGFGGTNASLILSAL